MNKLGIVLLLWMAGMYLSGCSTDKSQGADGDSTQTQSAASIPVEPALAQVPGSPMPVDPSWETLGNMEMVMFCLPYPKAEFQEDFTLAEDKAHHVLLSQDKTARLELRGMMLDGDCEKLKVNAMESLKTYAPLQHQGQPDGTLVLEWTLDNQRHLMKKWCNQSQGETVTAEITYPVAQDAHYRPIALVILSQKAVCE